jgi:hypothetical protein
MRFSAIIFNFIDFGGAFLGNSGAFAYEDEYSTVNLRGNAEGVLHIESYVEYIIYVYTALHIWPRKTEPKRLNLIV